jgi:hypothetical protein
MRPVRNLPASSEAKWTEEEMVERSCSRGSCMPLVCLAVALSILLQGVAWGQTVFSEDWESGSVDPTKWVVYGSPSSAIVSPGVRQHLLPRSRGR